MPTIIIYFTPNTLESTASIAYVKKQKVKKSFKANYISCNKNVKYSFKESRHSVHGLVITEKTNLKIR